MAPTPYTDKQKLSPTEIEPLPRPIVREFTFIHSKPILLYKPYFITDNYIFWLEEKLWNRRKIIQAFISLQ